MHLGPIISCNKKQSKHEWWETILKNTAKALKLLREPCPSQCLIIFDGNVAELTHSQIVYKLMHP